ncbi:AMP-binding protein, partial [Patulibacter sp. S7RM1-6]
MPAVDPGPDDVAVAPDDEALRAANARALAQPTLAAAFQVTWRAHGDRPALRRHGAEETVTWAQYGARVRALAGGLDALGIGRDDAVAILAGNVPAFNVLDTAALHVGAVPYSLYPTEPLEQMVALVEDAGARLLVADAPFLERALAVAAAVPSLVAVVALSGDVPRDGGTAGAEVLTLEALAARSRPGFDFDRTWRALDGEALATLVYTSGTTGKPKGVQISHRAVLAALRGVEAMVPSTPAGRGVSFLPAAHITDRFICHYTAMAIGGTITCVPDPDGLWEAIARTRPTRFFGVPRTWEKLADRARTLIDADPELGAALDVGRARVAAEQAGRPA